MPPKISGTAKSGQNLKGNILDYEVFVKIFVLAKMFDGQICLNTGSRCVCCCIESVLKHSMFLFNAPFLLEKDDLIFESVNFFP